MDQNSMGNNDPSMMAGPESQSPIDDMIMTVESYIKDPKLVTSETLTNLRDQLVDLKQGVEGDDSETSAEDAPEEGSLSSDIHKRRMGAF